MSEYFDGADIAIAVEEKEKKMTKRHCFVTDVGDAIEALATALDPERKPPFKGDILDLLEWATKDMLGMSKELATLKNEIKLIGEVLNDPRVDLTMTMSEVILELREQLERTRDWFEAQAKSSSKGNFSAWDLMVLREERDAIDKVLGELK